MRPHREHPRSTHGLMAEVAQPPSAVPTWTRHPVIPLPTREQLLAIAGAFHGAGRGPGEDRGESTPCASRRSPQRSTTRSATGSTRRASVRKPTRLLDDVHSELLLNGANRDGKTEYAAKHVVKRKLVAKARPGLGVLPLLGAIEHPPAATPHPPLSPAGVARCGQGGRGRVREIHASPRASAGTRCLSCPNGSQCLFFNYKQDVKVMEGYSFDGVWFDELVPIEFVDALDFRVDRERRLETLLTFTPVTGYTPTIAKFVAGAKIIETRPAHLLPPQRIYVKGCPQGHMPYVMKSPRPSAAVLFFHWGMNPYGAHAEVKEKLTGAPVEKVKIRAYGWADKLVGSALSEYDEKHRITRAYFNDVIEKGPLTRYVVVDPAGTKNWFIKWYACTPQGWTILYREWPDAQRYGAWALPPTKAENFDWRQGEAQRLSPPHGRGMDGYKRLILELEGWKFDEKTQTWDGSRSETILRRLIDPRMGDTQAPGKEEGTSIINLLAEETKNTAGAVTLPRMFFEEGPDSHVQQTVQMLNTAMAWKKNDPYSAHQLPKVVHRRRSRADTRVLRGIHRARHAQGCAEGHHRPGPLLYQKRLRLRFR
jgi:hypothetical protein